MDKGREGVENWQECVDLLCGSATMSTGLSTSPDVFAITTANIQQISLDNLI